MSSFFKYIKFRDLRKLMVLKLFLNNREKGKGYPI